MSPSQVTLSNAAPEQAALHSRKSESLAPPIFRIPDLSPQPLIATECAPKMLLAMPAGTQTPPRPARRLVPIRRLQRRRQRSWPPRLPARKSALRGRRPLTTLASPAIASNAAPEQAAPHSRKLAPPPVPLLSRTPA